VQTCHRVLSIGLWAAAALALATALLRGQPFMRAAALFALLTLEGILGVGILQAEQQPLVFSIVHQAAAIAILAAALAPNDLRMPLFFRADFARPRVNPPTP
jgi:hypothetical protein